MSHQMLQIGSADPESPEGSGSVRAAVGHIPLTEDSSLRELYNGRPNESEKFSLKEKAREESELYSTRSAAKELALRIEDSKTMARARRLELQQSRKPERSKDGDTNACRYSDVMRELGSTKAELSRLKLDVDSALDEKAKAEKAIESFRDQLQSYKSSAEELRKEVDEANEEYVLVELAKIEAEKELREIEAQRQAEATLFSKNMEMAKKKIRELRREINRSKELELKIAATNSDVIVLQNEMELVRAMERNSQKNPSSRDSGEFDSSSSLLSIEAELKAAKKELESIKANGFLFMTSMDLVREDMMHIANETDRLKRLEKRSDFTVQNLNSKILMAKSKLESALMAEERAKSIVSNLSAALQRMQIEIETAKEEKESARKETKAIKLEMEKTSNINSAEERLQAAIQELEAVKSSEAIAIKRLKHFSERVMKTRASTSLQSLTITISKSEYDYLKQGAATSQLVAGKKIVAAQSWIEALKAGETEISMKSGFIKREIKELRLEQEFYDAFENSSIARRTLEEGEPSNLRLARGVARKSMKENGMPAAARKAKIRYNPRSPSTIRRRRKAMPNLLKFIRNRRIGEQKRGAVDVLLHVDPLAVECI